MATFYKPTQMQGKRVVYRSLDPEEPKRDVLRIALLAGGLMLLCVGGWLVSR